MTNPTQNKTMKEKGKNLPTKSDRKKRIKLEEVPSSIDIAPDCTISLNKAIVAKSLPDVPLSSDSNSGSVRPTPEECRLVTAALAKLHPDIILCNQERQSAKMGTCAIDETILDGIVGTILSQNTTSANSSRAFANLKRRFPTWEQVEALPDPTELENAIRSAGLAKTKSERIHTMLKTIKNERGSVSLEYLHDLPDDKVKTELSRFKGLGPKTISCVMLFAMRRPEFPVDTHVHRICQRLGWTSKIVTSQSREATYQHLNAVIPNELKLDLHCLLIAHGKQCHKCAARGRPQFPPPDGSQLVCPLIKIKVENNR
jgi:endonuclease III